MTTVPPKFTVRAQSSYLQKWVVLSHPSAHNRPHQTSERNSFRFPFFGYWQASLTFMGYPVCSGSPSGLSSLNFPVLPPSCSTCGTDAEDNSVLPQSALASQARHEALGNLHSDPANQLPCGQSDFAASNVRLLSLPPLRVCSPP